jgi:uncharacterized protein YjdB
MPSFCDSLQNDGNKRGRYGYESVANERVGDDSCQPASRAAADEGGGYRAEYWQMSMGLSHGPEAQASFPTRILRRQLDVSLVALVSAMLVAATTSCGGDSGTAPVAVKAAPPVANVRLDRAIDSVEIQRNNTVTASFYDATGTPATPGSVTWKIADSTIATITSAGIVTGIRVGFTSATITADSIVRTLPIVVLPPAVASITYPTTSFALTEGDTLTLPAPRVMDRTGAVVTNRTLAYSSSSPNISVASNGFVTALGGGSGTVTVMVDTAHAILTFTVAAASVARVKLIPSVLDMGIGHKIGTQASAYGVSGQLLRGRTFTYSIDNPSVASVTSMGVVTGIAPGKATMTVSTGTGSVGIPLSVARLQTSGFTIDLRFIGNVSQAVRNAAAQAAARWEQAISAPLIPYRIVINAGDCGKGVPAIDTVETNMMIIIQTDSIDGPGKTVGLGGPCVIRDANPQLTALGTLTIDNADVAGLASQGILVGVITHEMGHILGIGTLWEGVPSYAGLASGLGGADPVFTGSAARAASAELGFTPDPSLGVPIENTGTVGDGTRDAHWRATVFGHELMTGTIHNGLNPLSLVSIETLADFGYTVVPEAADDFNVLNGTTPGAAITPSLSIDTRVRETILFPRFTTSRTGTLIPIRGVKPPATMQ